MKKTIIGIALLATSSSVFAVAPGGPNCGWGNMLFEGDSGIGSHFLASSTNGTSGNATFGMTSGTNGCSVEGKLTYGGVAMIGSMMNELTEDVARGDGEAMNAVAVLYGIQKEDRATFSSTMHQNFNTLFPNEAVTAEQVMASMNKLMKADSRLAKYLA